ncbi:MAG: DUF1640 domain-containing protein [Magnetococcales bacterium]|nr:DUF1640 domain-containing protein [Magnetococcales bacterium]MBF0114396.1 DUF1640 domain-containing protein [Magnetococcales bacterium]
MGATVAIPFDTLAYAKELETAGVPPEQAEAQAKALSNVLQKVEESRLQEMATKQDLRELELRMVIKMGAMILASVGLIIGYLRAFPMPVQIVQAAPQELRQVAPQPAIPPAR